MKNTRTYEVVLTVEIDDPSHISDDVSDDIAVMLEGLVIATIGDRESTVTRVLDAHHYSVASWPVKRS